MTTTAPPLIGIVADRKPVTSGAWRDVENDLLPHSYLRAITDAGGQPLLIPSLDVESEHVDRLLAALDGVLLAGGRDLDAATYGATPHPLDDEPLRVRDDLEIALIRGAIERQVPVLGVCRGMQVLNVALGGTLEQHLADRLDQTPHRDAVGTFTFHRVLPTPGSRLADAVGTKPFRIASHHHQAVAELGTGLIPSAVAPDDVVEAVELPGDDYVVGVQWHPEEDMTPHGLEVFRSFVRAATARIAARDGAGS